MSPVPDAIARELCQVFLGWRLREDYDALLGLEEGALRIDLQTGEAWCDGDPIPPLFIAGELRDLLAKRIGELAPPPVAFTARFEALFARNPRDGSALDISCRVELGVAGETHVATAHTGGSPERG